MGKNVSDYKIEITKALKAVGKYSRGLDIQITSLAGALCTLNKANAEIDALETDTLAPHPVFKIQKDAQDSVTRQMKALGLTAEGLIGVDDDDPLIDLTKKVKNATRKKANIIKPNNEDQAL